MAEFKLPDLGEGVTEGEVIEWRVAVGEEVELDQVLVVVGTDKATAEIPSPFQGKVGAILAPEGARIRVGAPLLRIDGPEPEAAAPQPEPAAAASPPAISERAGRDDPASSRVRALPSTRRAARQRGVDLGQVSGSRPGDRVRIADLLKSGRRVPLRGAARIMAERMAAAHRIVAQVTVVLESDMEAVEGAAGRPGGPTILGLICLAALAGLGDDPVFNASFDDQALEIVYHDRVKLGIAVQTPDGLVVATLADADLMAPATFQTELVRVVEAARGGQLSVAELGGSTFTVSSGGRMGGLLATPLVDWPNLAILGVHAIEDRAVVREGRVEVGRRANLSLSFDHRVIDGMRASAFLYRLADRLREPEKLLNPSVGGVGGGAETGS